MHSIYKILILHLVLAPLSSYGQKMFRENDSVRKYYHFKNKAELAIMDSNYSSSLRFYKTAFAYKSAEPRELINGLRVALTNRDTSFAKFCLSTLALNGLKESTTINFIGEQLTGIGSLYQYLAKDYNSLLNVFNKSGKPQLATILNRIYERDQAIRQGNTSGDFSSADANNIDSLIWFIHNYGFPGFQLLGFADPRGGIGTGGTFWIIYWHSRNQQIGLIDSLGLSAVMQGLYPPDEFAQVFDQKSSPSKYHMLVPGLAAQYGNGIPKLSDEVVNKNRAEIYLESMEDYKRKLMFMNSKKSEWFRNLFTPQTVYSMNFAR